MGTPPLRIALIGAGTMGRWYAQCFSEYDACELVAVCDVELARAEAVARAWGPARAYADFRDMLAGQELDAVAVATPDRLHREPVTACLEAGKHVLCEKPLATTVADGERMIEACQRAGVLLSTAFVCRYLPPVRRAWEICRAGELGEIYAVQATNHGTMPGGWFTDRSLAGGGAVVDHTVHVADLLRWFLGAEPVSVYAEIGRLFYHDLAVEDCGSLTLEFDNGAFATIDPSWSRPPGYPFWGDVTMTIVGSEATVSVDAFGQVFTTHHRESPSRWRNWGSSCDDLLIEDFVRSVGRGEPPAISGTDGLRATEVFLAAYRSAEARKAVKLAELRR
jgi:UDP-N-acetylglucosamine 3-dehydrogenase